MAYYTTWEYILFILAAFVFTITLLCVLYTACDNNDYYKSSDEYLEYTSDTENENDDNQKEVNESASSQIKFDMV